ncbi:unnamed protein product [Meganyctiphanes norvegica]|uniref:Small ribosomal subunit protein uS2 C-terminal domain-containing protein n=1 Tax=Meganyctiphanes norvegica TaxID=48144 RepID=A0AAV2R1I1_MEGNR
MQQQGNSLSGSYVVDVVPCLHRTISCNLPWETDVMPDLFYRDPEEQEKEEAAKAEAAKAEADAAKVIEAPVAENWGGNVADAAVAAATPVPAAGAVAGAPAPASGAVAAPPATDDWNQSVDDWDATPATTTGDDWGG